MTNKIKDEKLQWVYLLIEELSLQYRSSDTNNKAQVTQFFMTVEADVNSSTAFPSPPLWIYERVLGHCFQFKKSNVHTEFKSEAPGSSS